MATTYTLCPYWIEQPLNDLGAIVPNGYLYTYAAGSSTPVATYQTSTGTAQANPIRLDTEGRVPNGLYLQPGQSYKFDFRDANNVSIKIQDNILAVPASTVNVDIDGIAGEDLAAGVVAYLSDGSNSKTAGQWFQSSASADYSSLTPTIAGVVNAIAQGMSGTFRSDGQFMYGAGGLVTGAAYYLDTNAGAITATAPQRARYVGQAINATTLAITPNPRPPAVLQPLEICEGRLTLTSGVPVTTGDVSAATTVYWTPYKGNRIALYDGAVQWNERTFTELSISLMGFTASKPYDVFAYDNAGTVTLETLVWTNATTRATALTTQNGVLVKTGATTRRYLGTIYINGSGGQTDDTAAIRSVYNYAQPVPRAVSVIEGTNSWTYTTATFRQANGSTANQVTVMQGWAEKPLNLRVLAHASNSGGSVPVSAAIGQDVTNAGVAGSLIGYATTGSAGTIGPCPAEMSLIPAVGYHVYAWLEASDASGTTTWYGDNGGTRLQSGMAGIWWC